MDRNPLAAFLVLLGAYAVLALIAMASDPEPIAAKWRKTWRRWRAGR